MIRRSSINSNLKGLEQSATLAINQKCREIQEQGEVVYKLGLGQSPFPVPKTVVKSLEAHAGEKDYLPVEGLPDLRRAVADFHRRKNNIASQPDNVLIGPGSKELLFLLQLVHNGHTIIPNPCWVSYRPQAKILGKKIGIVDTTFEDGWKINAESLDELCREKKNGRRKLLILNYPGNPTGTTYKVKELKELAKVARKHDLVVLSDEIYGELHHKGKHASLARFYPEGTIISSGLSKWCGAGGWRLGTFLFPSELNWLKDAMAIVASETYTSVSAPIQHAAVEAFKGGEYIEHYLSHTRRILSELGRHCADTLSKSDVKVHSPEGAFYLFADFSNYKDRLAERGIEDGKSLCDSLLRETGVAILPGSEFLQPEEELTARLAYVDFDGAAALSASYHIHLDQKLPADFLENMCSKVVSAIDKVVEWLGR